MTGKINDLAVLGASDTRQCRRKLERMVFLLRAKFGIKKGRMMKCNWLVYVASPILLIWGVVATADDSDKSDNATETKVAFSEPVRLKGGDEFIKTESPGYACPCWADMDSDGKKDLIIGQFNGGKMKVYRNLGDGKFDEGKWLEAEGDVAEVPGVW
jgi:hypothetical protein